MNPEIQPTDPNRIPSVAIPTPPSNKKKKLLLIIISCIVVLLVAAGVLIGLSVVKQGTKSDNHITDPTPLPQSPTKNVSKSTEYKKGDNNVRFGHFQLMINKIERNYTIQNDKKQPDLENVLIDLTVKNIDSSIYSISDADFVIKDDNGTIISHDFTKSVKPDFKTTNLEPGASLTGNLVYEVPKNQLNLKIYYVTQIYNDKKMKFENQEFLLPF